MRYLTLNRTWELCLTMWKWIVEQLNAGSRLPIWRLKRAWLAEFGKGKVPEGFCYFCEYNIRHNGGDCTICPIKLISRNLGCGYKGFSWNFEPRKFYARLLRLDKRRRTK